MRNSSTRRVVPMIVVLLVGASLALVVWVVRVEETENETTDNDPSRTDGGPADSEPQAPSVRNANLKTRPVLEDGQKGSPEFSVLREPRLASNEGAVLGSERERQDLAEHGNVSRETLGSWADNQDLRVGPKTWLPRLSPEEEGAITEILKRPMPSPIAGLEVRRMSIEAFKDHAHLCYERLRERAPEARGRAIVVWEIEGNGRWAIADKTRLGPVVDLTEPEFVNCLQRVQFTGWPSDEVFGPILIEYPLMLP